MNIPTNGTPATPSVKPPAPKEPATRVAPAFHFEDDLANKTLMHREMLEVLTGPGDALNLSTGKKLSEVRSQLDLGQSYQGLHAQKGQTPSAQNVPNPDSPDGRWDPLQFMPRFAFDPQEDAFPVAPDFDGDQNLENNGAVEANGPDGHYQDGVIGGDQPLSGAFTVSKKGEYTVLTYSFYSATNKAVHYHNNDYSTAQVYLKPGQDGKLEPTHMSTSWHHGSVLTKWEDLAKDDQGRPVVKVHRGSHALQAVAEGDDLPTDGVQIAGDGTVTKDGKPLPHRLGFEAFQTNVRGATYKSPTDPNSAARLEAMRWGEAAMNPFLPEVYEDAPSPLLQMGERYLGKAVDKAEQVVDSVEEKAGDLLEDAQDLIGDAAETGKDLIEKIPFL